MFTRALSVLTLLAALIAPGLAPTVANGDDGGRPAAVVPLTGRDGAPRAALRAGGEGRPDATGRRTLTTPAMRTEEFLVAGLAWTKGTGLPDGARILIRVLEKGGWSPWKELDAFESGDDGPAGTAAGTGVFLTGGSRAVQVRIDGLPAGRALPAQMRLVLVPANPSGERELDAVPPEPDLEPPADAPVPPPEAELLRSEGSAAVVRDAARTAAAGAAASLVPALVSAPNIITRSGWGADESLMTWKPKFAELKAAVVHHTAGTNNYTADQSASIVRGIYYFHAVTRGWGDIGYNFLFDKFGQVFEGRSGSLAAGARQMAVGAHALNFNTGTVGLSAMGDYSSITAPQVVLDRMADVAAWRFSLAGLDPSAPSGITSPGTSARPAGQNLPRIFGHRDVGYTTCPGNDIYSRLPALINTVTRKVHDTNLARAGAAVTASSESPWYGQTAAKAVDGSAAGYPGDYTREWATAGGKVGTWIEVSWPAPVAMSRVVLFDRPNGNDQVTAGTLSFSDGSSVGVGALNNGGGPVEVAFAGRTVTSVRFTVTGVSGSTQNVGLSEFEVWGAAAVANLARSGAAVSASSESPASGQTAVKAVDGVPDGYPGDYTREWATAGGKSGSWLQLTWPVPVTLHQVVLFDRPNGNDRITAGTLSFSDGSSVAVGALANDGAPTGIGFSPRTVTSVRLTVTGVAAATENVGLAEFEAFGTAAISNLAGRGAVSASSEAPATGQTAAKAVDGVADGYPGDYAREWATQAGKAGSWLQVNWSAPVRVNRVVLFDRPNGNDQVTAGTLTFSDGSKVSFGVLPNDGSPATVVFPARTVTSVRFTATGVAAFTENVGLAEMEVWGALG